LIWVYMNRPCQARGWVWVRTTCSTCSRSSRWSTCSTCIFLGPVVNTSKIKLDVIKISPYFTWILREFTWVFLISPALYFISFISLFLYFVYKNSIYFQKQTKRTWSNRIENCKHNHQNKGNVFTPVLRFRLWKLFL
jgi:hypothetical protein